MQIDLTWNLFVSPIMIAGSTLIITRYLNHKDKKREEREQKREAEKTEQRAKLTEALKEKEALKEAELTGWRQRYETNVNDIKGRLEEIKTCMRSKADETLNRAEHSKFYGFRDDHEKRIIRIEEKG